MGNTLIILSFAANGLQKTEVHHFLCCNHQHTITNQTRVQLLLPISPPWEEVPSFSCGRLKVPVLEATTTILGHYH